MLEMTFVVAMRPIGLAQPVIGAEIALRPKDAPSPGVRTPGWVLGCDIASSLGIITGVPGWVWLVHVQALQK